MIVVAISDTHGMHEGLVLPEGDVLVHAGDFTRRGSGRDVSEFVDWIESTPFRHKVIIAGNHDFALEKYPGMLTYTPEGVHYLEDSGISLDGVNFWGSPWTPEFHHWAFNEPRRGEHARIRWSRIPVDTNVLVTHGPPMGILDECSFKYDGYPSRAGCEELAKRVLEVGPDVHIFGHIHESAGSTRAGATTYINASSCSLSYNLVNEPFSVYVKEGDR